MSIRVGLVSLGCPKNQVDAELMLAKLSADDEIEITNDTHYADVIVINTCSFIEDAKKESIDSILEIADFKRDGFVKKIVVTGCLAERYRDEIKRELPEVDCVLGLGANAGIVDAVKSVARGEARDSFPENTALPLSGDRALSTPEYLAYLRIADGCSAACSYCAIPSIRGPYRSRSEEDIVDEARKLADGGVKELILIAQDTTRYGLDLYGELRLPELLKKLCAVEGIHWIRMLYCYPDAVTDRLLDVMASEPKLLHYIDVPLQHASGRILRAMRRPGNMSSYLELLSRIREKMPDCVIRTTFIAGFPGETDDDYDALAEFVHRGGFDRMGCFAYSQEEGTPAAAMPDQVDPEIKRDRVDALMTQQYGIHLEKQKARLGQTVECVVEGYDAYTDSYYGRTWMDAPEIDAGVVFTSEQELSDGEFVKVRLFEVNDYDYLGEAVF